MSNESPPLSFDIPSPPTPVSPPPRGDGALQLPRQVATASPPWRLRCSLPTRQSPRGTSALGHAHVVHVSFGRPLGNQGKPCNFGGHFLTERLDDSPRPSRRGGKA